MPGKSPSVIDLAGAERAELEARSRGDTSPHRTVVRAKIVLLARQGPGNDRIAGGLDAPRRIVSQWRRRFDIQRLAGLEEPPRSGRPARCSRPPLLPPIWWWRSRRWPVSCRVVEACPGRAGQSPNRAQLFGRGARPNSWARFGD